MKEIELNYIEINGVKYPLYCDLNVLELIQDNFESVSKFERDLMGLTPLRDEEGELKRDESGSILNRVGEPKIRAVVFGLYLMIKEGQRIDTRQTGKEHEEISIDEIREVCTKPFDIASILHDEFNRCFDVKKKSTPRTRRKRNTQK